MASSEVADTATKTMRDRRKGPWSLPQARPARIEWNRKLADSDLPRRRLRYMQCYCGGRVVVRYRGRWYCEPPCGRPKDYAVQLEDEMVARPNNWGIRRKGDSHDNR
jgi:hypothetical protein